MRPTSLLLFFLPVILLAQNTTNARKPVRVYGPSFISAQDSLDFAHFLERAESKADTSVTFALPGDYRMVWHEKREGGWWMVMRGNGRSLEDLQAHPPDGFFPYGSPPIALGPRSVVVELDLPTGLIRQDRWYFEVP